MTAPRLIVLNGPPAIGKSTIAQRYVDDHPLSLNLDLDSVRRMLGGWLDSPTDAGLLARELGLVMARAHLMRGRDVVMPQYLGRLEFLQQAEDLATATGADFFEFVLMDHRDAALRRFATRTAAGATPAHVEAAALLERLGGEDTLAAMYDRLLLLLNSRPRARLVAAREGDIDAVYREISAAVHG